MVERRCWPTISKLIKRKGECGGARPVCRAVQDGCARAVQPPTVPVPELLAPKHRTKRPANLPTDGIAGGCVSRERESVVAPESRARAIYRYLLGRCTSGRRARIVAWAAGCIHIGTTICLPVLAFSAVQSFLPGPGWRETAREARFLMQRNGRQMWCRFPLAMSAGLLAQPGGVVVELCEQTCIRTPGLLPPSHS